MLTRLSTVLSVHSFVSPWFFIKSLKFSLLFQQFAFFCCFFCCYFLFAHIAFSLSKTKENAAHLHISRCTLLCCLYLVRRLDPHHASYHSQAWILFFYLAQQNETSAFVPLAVGITCTGKAQLVGDHKCTASTF